MAKSVSDNFKNIIKAGGPFYAYASVLLSTGETVVMTSEQDFTLTGNGYSEDGGTGFPLGMALSRSITLNIDNTSIIDSLKDISSDNILDHKSEDILATRKSAKTDYYQARITLYTEADLPDGTTERIREGIFTVIDAVTPGEILKITAYDDMYKADTPFTSLLSYPASAQALLNEVCTQCGITLGSATFRNNNFQIQQAPEALTGRQIIGYIAQIAGGNAVIDSNARLIIKTYDLSGFDQEEEVSADEIETSSGIHIISQYTEDPDIGTDDVTITGVTVEIEHEDTDETEVYTAGTAAYAMSVDNPLISGKEKEAVDLISDVVIGITLRPFSGKFMPDPTIEFMDLAYLVDKNDNQYKTFITTHDFEYLSNSTLSNGTESPERHNGSYYSTAAEAYQKAKKDLKVNRTQWEQAIESLSQQVANASGLYTTEEEQPDGSTIFYMHNKPTLEESNIVWKMTAETLTVSTDGGHSWNAGITVNGEVIARIMNTIGINFDWGVGGTLIIQDADGNQTAYIDAETGTVRLAVESLTITGKTVQEIASEQSDETLNNFVDSVYNPAIGNLQAQIDGQIETYYYDYEPTLNNEPASEWTTEEERRNHEGDLFYWKSKGYAYRFFKDGDTWKWQMVQDTDITKALEEAADAKDTADQKRRVFVTQPYPPYDVGDLWVGDDTSEMMRCQRARSSGSYVASDWIKAVKYTDDSELYNFVQNDYNETIKDIYNSVDQKSETWYQATDPALEWTEIESTPLQDTTGANILDTAGETIITIWEKEKSLHNGDLWKNSTTNKEYLYQNGEWVEMPIPDEVFDMIDGKAKIFVVQPTPPYDVGDVWFTGTTILVCNTKRENGSFSESDWGKKDNYTDDSALYEFIEGDYSETVENLKNQADKKAETWYQSTDPSTGWTAEEKAGHTGDLWYNTAGQKTYIYNGTGWEETKSTPPDEVFDSIDGKAQIFVSTPAPPYSVGDLWFDSASSDIMTCVTARISGSFNASDWEKRNKYTDDSALQNFLSGEYSETITELKNQADKKAETWYQGTDPSTSWNATQKAEHEGDLWYNTSNQKTYIYDGSAWQETKSTPPDEVFDEIDGKAQIFVRQPVPPYSVGDLWFNSATSDIMTCITARPSGSYNAKDWEKRNKYTDDSYAQEINDELNRFIEDYNDEIQEIANSIDKKSETWYQTSDPANQWTDNVDNDPLLDTNGNNITDTTGENITTVWEKEKTLHDGDLWHNPNTNKEYIYVDGEWKETSIPDDVFDIIDGKAQIFVSTPTPPYAIGDLWFNSATSDIMTCINGRESGSYTSSDWQKRNKYTDDSYAEVVSDNLQNFADQVTGDIDDIQTQLDGKIETYYYDYQPTLSNIPASVWTTEEERQKHIGDLFYWKSKGFTYRFLKDGNVWKWQAIKDSDIDEALQQAATAQDTADGKRRVFTSTPTPPYDVGDLWAQGSNGDIMRCKTARSSGAYVSTDWEKASKYTDDTAVDDLDEKLNSTEEIFNRLTQDGKVKGIYLKNGQLYINASYLASGAINIRDSDGNETLYANVDTGVVRIKATSFSLTDGRSIEDIASDEINDFVTSIYTPKINSLQSQIDGQIETYYYDYQPTLTNVPASAWTTETERQSHEGDIFYWKSKGYAYRFYKDGSTWKWQLVQDTDITKALQQAADAQDTADQKRRVFVRQPTPPYDVGDLWAQGSSGDIMRCQTTRASGNYVASDWIKASKYTDDSYAQEVNQELNQFITDYQDEIKEIQNQVDQKSETWYQTSDPALQWTGKENIPLADTTGASILDTTGATITTIRESEKMLHDGDLWHNPSNNNEYIYQDGEWHKTSIPDDVFDIIDGKAQIFVNQPAPPYAVGDLWFNSATSDIMTCIAGREKGSYNAADWQKRNKYTDDSYAEVVSDNLQNFADQVTGDIDDIQTQLDGKIETYYYDYQPTLSNIPASVWTTEEERQKHIGDLFYWKSKGFTYRFLKDGNVWKWQAIKDEDISKALSDAADAQDTADSKRRVFTSTPTPPYDVGDLWVQGGSGDIMRCIRSRSSGNYTSSDWDKASKYTDDSAVGDLDDSLDQQGIFNRLTNEGTVQGLYMENGQIYVLFTYAKGGVLSLGGKNNGNGYAQILNEDDEVIAELDSNGIGILGQFQVSGENSYGKKSWSILAPSELFFYDSQRQVIGYLNAMIDNNGVAAANLTGNDAVTLNLRYNSNQVYKHYILADDNYRLYDQTVKRWHTFFGDERHNGDSYFSKIFLGSDDGNDCYLQYTNYYNSGAISSSGGFYAYGDLGCQGTKHRIVQTDDYQKRLLYSYETPSPYFGDLGCGETDDAGICVIVFDDIFLETVNTKCDYQVFLQKEGPGDIWVESKSFDHIVVRGTPNLKFSWEAKVKQKGYEYQRLEAFELSQDGVESIDYERQAEVMVEKYYKELEEMFV